MNDDEKEIKEASDPESPQSEPDFTDSTTADAHRSQNTQQPELNVQGHGNGNSSTLRRSTGPGTAAGKNRSKYNALKTGLFSKALLLPGESPAEFKVLLNGLREEWQPQGTSEEVLVEYLATLFLRKRRVMQAERAEISKVTALGARDFFLARAREDWDRSREGESSGGMLRHISNPLVVRRAIEMLEVQRNGLEKFGFRKGEDCWLLRKLYGLDHDKAVPWGMFSAYQHNLRLATATTKGYENRYSPDEMKAETLGALDQEIKRLEMVELSALAADEQRAQYETTAALVPSPGVLERLIRADAHLSREIDRTFTQLDNLQRRRSGQPRLPAIKVDVTS